jgi:hypothetical protein
MVSNGGWIAARFGGRHAAGNFVVGFDFQVDLKFAGAHLDPVTAAKETAPAHRLLLLPASLVSNPEVIRSVVGRSSAGKSMILSTIF